MKKKLLSILVATATLSSYSSFTTLAENINTKPTIQQNYSVKKSSGTSSHFEDKKNDVYYHGALGQLSINEQSILAFLKQNESKFAAIKGTNDFKVLSISKDNTTGYTTVKVAQALHGVAIRGSEMTLHLDKNGVVKSIIGAVNNNYRIQSYAVAPKTISPEQAIATAKKQFTYSALVEQPQAEKQVIVKNGAATTVYSVNIHYLKPDIANWEVLIDVNTGKVLNKLDKVRYDSAVTGSGLLVNNTTKSLNLTYSNRKYEMIDSLRGVKTYTANNEETEPGTLVTGYKSVFNTEVNKAEVSAHYYAGVVHDFYQKVLGRNSIDNNGMNIISTAHYGSKYDNAYWDGSQMVYGDGDGSQFTYFSGDLDVVGHELTHGVTQYTANLDYQDQSGALNESMSDVMGVLIQTYDKYDVKDGGAWKFSTSDWVVGDDISTTGTPLRSLADPTLYNQPATMDDYASTSDDNGGVHTNSGIPNKAAYLVAKSIGCKETANIYYKALSSYLTSSSDFSAARNAFESAAKELYGDSSDEVTAVDSAFDTVGVSGSSSNNSGDNGDWGWIR